jgi:hypothetical protein
MATVCAQTPYPELTIQDVSWMEGTHHYAVTNSILSPATPERPTEIGASADVEFVSATEVRLLPGFHAGAFNSQGQFHARIDQGLGQPADLVIISPAPDGSSPYGSIEDNVVHVHKWEKVEVGLRLPQEYQEAIDRFFDAFYPLASSGDFTAAPTAPDATHDLNPYADDSLQLVMTLTRPDGLVAMKWGFFMREGKWENDLDPDAKLVEDTTDTNHPYHIRFRFAPDKEGSWQFAISIKAPYTTTLWNSPLADLSYTGCTFICDPPLADNNGHLRVNPENRRNLQFEGDEDDPDDQSPFFALGVNMSDVRRDLSTYQASGTAWTSYYQRDFDIMKTTMSQLHEVGGNFLRMYLMRNIFAPEWVNLGVYDAYVTPEVCDTSVMSCPNGGWSTGVEGNCQYQSWAFDQILDHARVNDLYIQLCIDPYPPIIDYEQYIWGAHPYAIQYLEPNREFPPNPNPFDMKRFFYSYQGNADPDDSQAVRLHDQGVFYYWKRKYKYIMSRWGYSVNLPIIEPFNEIDQMLSYSYKDMSIDPSEPNPCADNGAICVENRVEWFADTALRSTINDWLSDLWAYVEGPQIVGNPESPLGENKKLLLMSYAGGNPAWSDYHLPFTNDNVDLIDAHRAPDANPHSLLGWAYTAEAYRNNPNFRIDGQKKPFHHGEFTSYGDVDIPGLGQRTSYKFFDNYNISFHNELWATTFSSCFGAGTTWGWERVFWWKDALQHYPNHLPLDTGNPAGFDHFSDQGEVNYLYLGDAPSLEPYYSIVTNRPVHHQFRPLVDFLNKPSVQALGLFEGDFTPIKHEANGIECIYLMSETQDVAVGWVHNRSAYWKDGYYVANFLQRYMQCADPSAQEIALPGFTPNTELKISYFPTWLGQVNVPNDEVVNVSSDANGFVTLDLQSASLNGTYPLSLTAPFRNHLDTLHSDYAFIVATDLIKSLRPLEFSDTVNVQSDWDFALYPNPTRGELQVHLPEGEPKSIIVFDLSGRVITSWNNVSDKVNFLQLGNLAKGAYWIRVTNSRYGKTKKLLLQ